MAWSDNNMAQVDTWFTLFRLKQTQTPFPEAGKLKMEELAFFNPTISKDLLKIEATLLANTIDGVFTAFGVKLEPTISRSKALSEMVNTIVESEKTLEDLALINDENYLFVNEKKYVNEKKK